MAKSKTSYPEIENIREDIDSLKSNTIELGRHIKKDGEKQTRALAGSARERLAELKVSGREQMKHVEGHVKEKPLQSMAIAFAAGVFASMLLGRR